MTTAYLLPLADHLWQSTLFVAAVWIVNLALRKNRAAVRHRLWLAASVKFLVPFSLLVSIGSNIHWRTAPPTAPPPISIFMDEIGQPFTASDLPTVPLSAEPAPQPSRIPSALIFVWICGFAASIVWWSIQWRRLRRAMRQAKTLDLDVPIRVMCCPERVEPGVFGIIRPALLLPEGITDRLSPEQLKAVLAHEMCHVRRRDNLTAAIHMLVEASFWFHPLVWWIKVRLIEEQERACDEEVLRVGGDPQIYAESILKICEFYVTAPLICVSGITGADLKKRIAAIMRGRISRELNFTRKLLLAIVGILAVFGPIVIGLVKAPLTHAQSTTAAIPKWEVVSIKPCEPDNSGRRLPQPPQSPGRLTTNCQPVEDFIRDAYIRFAEAKSMPFGNAGFVVDSSVVNTPIEGGPSWIRSDRYQILARAEDSPHPEMMKGPMLQSILEERFKLRVRHGRRDVPAYALTVAKASPKLHAVPAGSCIEVDQRQPPPPNPLHLPGCGFGSPDGANGFRTITTMDSFAVALSTKLDRTVVNKTNLTGLFDIHVPDDPSVSASDLPGSFLFAAVQDLGLKLDSTKAPLDYIIVEHIERPTENGVEDQAGTASVPQIASLAPIVPPRRQQSPPRLPQNAAPTQPLKFEVATIKPSRTGENVTTWGCNGIDGGDKVAPVGRCIGRNVPLKFMIALAYGVPFGQIKQLISGGPGWLDSVGYDIEAKSDPPATEAQLYLMLQTFLSDQIKLRVHRENKDIPAFALTVGTAKSKLHESTADEESSMSAGTRNGMGWINGQKATMSKLATTLSSRVGRVVIDKTGLTGTYDFALTWQPEGDVNLKGDVGASADRSGPSIFTALQEQLGLKLEQQKVQASVLLIIDSAEKPSPN